MLNKRMFMNGFCIYTQTKKNQIIPQLLGVKTNGYGCYLFSRCPPSPRGGSYIGLLFLERKVVRPLHHWSMDYSLRVVFSLILIEAGLSDYTPLHLI